MAEIVAKEKSPIQASRNVARSGPGLSPVRVLYYRQMKLQRVYAVEVSWQKTDRPARPEVLTVRLSAAGAQVVPAEQALDAAKPDAKAIFHVTPLARGWLPNQKLEVLDQAGRKVREIPLACKVVSQRITWV